MIDTPSAAPSADTTPDAAATPPQPPTEVAAPAAPAAPGVQASAAATTPIEAATPVPDLAPAACAAELASRFPALFGAGRALPIKLRIQADIQQRAPGVFSRKSLSLFLHRHTTSTAYLRALVNSPQRFDLDGAAAGEVAEEHRLAAVAEVERRRAIVEARRAAEREAARETQRQAAAARRQQPGAPAPQGAGGAAAAEAQAPRPPRPPASQQRRPPRPPQAGPAPRHAEAGPRPPQRPERGPRPAPAEAAATGPAEPQDEARRERAALLRTYEGSSLTRANFCVLKRISETELEAQLALARQEREQRAPPVARPRPPQRG